MGRKCTCRADAGSVPADECGRYHEKADNYNGEPYSAWRRFHSGFPPGGLDGVNEKRNIKRTANEVPHSTSHRDVHMKRYLAFLLNLEKMRCSFKSIPAKENVAVMIVSEAESVCVSSESLPYVYSLVNTS